MRYWVSISTQPGPHPKCPQVADWSKFVRGGVPVGADRPPLKGQFSISEQRVASDLGGGPGWVLIPSHPGSDRFQQRGHSPLVRFGGPPVLQRTCSCPWRAWSRALWRGGRGLARGGSGGWAGGGTGG